MCWEPDMVERNLQSELQYCIDPTFPKSLMYPWVKLLVQILIHYVCLFTFLLYNKIIILSHFLTKCCDIFLVRITIWRGLSLYFTDLSYNLMAHDIALFIHSNPNKPLLYIFITEGFHSSIVSLQWIDILSQRIFH